MTANSGSSSVDDRVSSLFQPDTLLADQYLETQRRNTPLEPEKRLMMAMLDDAVSCFQKYVNAQRRKEQALFQEVEEWFFDKDSDWFYSFENVSESLGLDPDYVRDGLARWKEMQVRPKAKIYHLNTVQRTKSRAARLAKSSTHKPRDLKSGTK